MDEERKIRMSVKERAIECECEVDAVGDWKERTVEERRKERKRDEGQSQLKSGAKAKQRLARDVTAVVIKSNIFLVPKRDAS
jgi:hypothetical protein